MFRPGRVLDLGPMEPETALIGIEHEYRVLDGDRQVDFRELIHTFELGQPHLDPADPNAYRLASGAALTCDEAEAEIALPPVALHPHFAAEIDARAVQERARLEALVSHLHVDGYSTHISVSTPADVDDQVAAMYVRTFALSLMLLMDGRGSPGLLVRPRPGRTELGGEFIDGHRLRAAAVFAVGSVLRCVEAVARGRADIPELDLQVLPDDRRYGWFVARCAAGEDLYTHGRRKRLVRSDGTTSSAQAHLEVTWLNARELLVGRVADGALSEVDLVVSGRMPLACESERSARDHRPSARLQPAVHGKAVATRQRPLYGVAPVMVGWHTVVLVVADRSAARRAFINVPRLHLRGFLDALDSGNLDAEIDSFLARRSWRGRKLRTFAQTDVLALYERLGRRKGLLPSERKPTPRGFRRYVAATRGVLD